MRSKSDYRAKFAGSLSIHWEWNLILSFFLLIPCMVLLWYKVKLGLIAFGVVAVYLLVIVLLYYYMRRQIIKDLISFAAGYGQVQSEILRRLDLPCAMMDADANVIWMNDKLSVLTGKVLTHRGGIDQVFPEVTRATLPVTTWEKDVETSFSGRDYRAHLQRICVDDLLDSTDLVKSQVSGNDFFIMYLFDETDMNRYIQENRDQKSVVALLYIDNYEEVMERTDEVHQSLLNVLVERRVGKYFSNVHGLVKKLEKDKYLIVLSRKDLDALVEDRFSILEDVKTINIGNDMNLTISIGVGYMGAGYPENYDLARLAIEMALGRGGDQAVVREGEEITFFGGRSQRSERVTHVRARVKAQALREMMLTRDKVVAMGHNLADMDSFGAAVGICRAAMTVGKKSYIVLGEQNPNIREWVTMFRENREFPEDYFITGEQAKALVDNNTMVVVVDTNRRNMVECPQILDQSDSVVVLDHHRQTRDTMENAALSYIEPTASSASEMVAEILQYFEEDVRLRNLEADSLYAGIVIDTQSFVTKTGVRTFEAAAYLRKCGADGTRVRKALRDNINNYMAKAEAVQSAETYMDYYAITICRADGLEFPSVVGAQAANDLLNIVNIKASFVITPADGKIFVSARSIDELNVQLVMERMGGGGHLNIAGAQLSDMTETEAVETVKRVLKEMTEEGAI